MRFGRLALMGAVLLLALGGVSSAAVDPVDILIQRLVDKKVITEKDAGEIRSEIAALQKQQEAEKTTAPAAAPAAKEPAKEAPKPVAQSVTSRQPMKLGILVQELYRASDIPGAREGLEMRKMRLMGSGKVSDQADYRFTIETAGVQDAAGASAGSTVHVSKPTALDVEMGLNFKAGRVSAGQFKVPFGMENLASDLTLDTVNRAETTERLVPARDTRYQGRDQGIQYSNRFALVPDGKRALDVTLGFFNGAAANTPDDNEGKDIAGRLVYHPGVEGMQLGLAHYAGSLGAARSRHLATGGEFAYNWGKWSAKSEYITARQAMTRKWGYYGLVTRMLGANTQGVLRYDLVDPNTGVDRDRVGTFTAGWNWFISKDTNSRLQVDYERRRDQSVSGIYNTFLAQVQTAF